MASYVQYIVRILLFMKKISTLLILFILGIISLKAQTAGNITGAIVDGSNKEGIAQATVKLLKKDSTYINGTATDLNGKFRLAAKPGSYIVEFSYIGFVTRHINVTLTAAKPTHAFGEVELSHDNILLKEAVVTAKATEIAVKGDTLEYNANSYKVQQGAVVEDLLKKMPGVEVDTEGKITVNGKQVKKILIDGEEFFSNDPKVASKNLPANMVEKLQVVDRRSDMAQMTGFDDGEEETVINLNVKPGMKEGLMGTAFAGYGSKQRYEGNLMVNYMKNKDQYTFLGGVNNTNNAGFSDIASGMFGGGRGMRGGFGNNNGLTKAGNAGLNFSKTFTGKLKVGGNLRFGETDNNTITQSYTQNLIKSGNTFEKENENSNNRSRNFNTNFRLEWTPDSITRVIMQPEFSAYKNNRSETSEFETTNLNNDIINKGNSTYNSQGDGKNMGLRLDASRELGKKGRVLSMQVRTNVSDSKNEGENQSNTYYNGSRPDDIIDQRFNTTSDSKSWRTYVSYVEPVGKNNFIQLAYNYSQNISNSDKQTFNKDANDNYSVLDTLYSKRLYNRFDNQGIEVNFKAVRAKYDYMFGFSIQPSSMTSKTYVGDVLKADLSQKVMNYAPMAQFNYRWNRQKNLRINYDGTTDQPTVEQLSPVRDISNPLNVVYGNPDLKPSFTHALRVRYMDFDPKSKRSMAFFSNANYLTNDVVSITRTDFNTGRKETTYTNVRGNWNANARFMTNLPLKNVKYSFFSMTYAGYNHTNGFSNGEENLNKRINLMQAMGINYRSTAVDLSLRGRVGYNTIKNSLNDSQNQEYYDYSAMANTTIYLPYDISLTSDITYNTNAGYAQGYKLNEWLWNASIQKQLFKNKNGTLRFKIYDILQQRSNISRSVTPNYIRDVTTNTLTSYFMVHFIYRFNIFKGGATSGDMQMDRGYGH